MAAQKQMNFRCFASSVQTNELVVSLEEDEKLILQNDQTLRAAGVGKSSISPELTKKRLNFIIVSHICHIQRY